MDRHLRPPWSYRPPLDLDIEVTAALSEDGISRNEFITNAVRRELKARKRAKKKS